MLPEIIRNGCKWPTDGLAWLHDREAWMCSGAMRIARDGGVGPSSRTTRSIWKRSESKNLAYAATAAVGASRSTDQMPNRRSGKTVSLK